MAVPGMGRQLIIWLEKIDCHSASVEDFSMVVEEIEVCVCVCVCDIVSMNNSISVCKCVCVCVISYEAGSGGSGVRAPNSLREKCVFMSEKKRPFLLSSLCGCELHRWCIVGRPARLFTGSPIRGCVRPLGSRAAR